MKKLAKKGGGPTSVAGKEIVAKNAITNGLHCNVVVAGEDQSDWQTHLAACGESLQPANHLEREVTMSIAWILWRQRRLMKYDSASARHGLAERRRISKAVMLPSPPLTPMQLFSMVDQPAPPRPAPPPPDDATIIELSALPMEAAWERIAKTESHLRRELDRALDRLQTLQAMRGRSTASGSLVVTLLESRFAKTNLRTEIEARPRLDLPAPLEALGVTPVRERRPVKGSRQRQCRETRRMGPH